MPDYAAADALTQGEVGKDIFKILENQVVLWGARTATARSATPSWRSNASRHEGPKSAVGSPLFLDTFTALGANPTNEAADAQPALATGAVDGQENDVDLHRRGCTTRHQSTSRCGATSTTR
jgi:TRAP-type C4-dicarboxylate transport system substrate-binding protein